LVLPGSVRAAEWSPKGEVDSAAKALAAKPNYSWRLTTVVPEGSPFRPGPWDGRLEKDGFTLVTMRFGENNSQFVLKGDKAAVTNPEGSWLSLAEMEGGEGPGRFFAMLIRNFKAPAAQALELVSYAKELRKDGDAYASELTEEGAKSLLAWRAPGNAEGPKVSNASGAAKFWLKDGALTKYEFKLKGTVSFNGNDFESDRTTTVEIKDVGTTQVTVPEKARKKIL
jgi:hypothetical protein